MKNWLALPKPIIGLSPMADYTDEPFCLVCKKYGADVIFREMVSADAIVHNNKKTLKMIKINDAERPVIQQIFGRDPQIMAEAAKIIYEKVKPDGIDINMGCPAHKVVKNFHGAALMKTPELAKKIIMAVKWSVPIPVSVKTRLGWSKNDEILNFAPMVEEAGADLISIHGRTKNQGYTGDADWDMIAKVKQKIKIPILANGSIFEVEDIKKCLNITNCGGVLIARGALGNPWIFKGINKNGVNMIELAQTILEHAQNQINHYGDYGMILLRKHLLYYLKNIPRAKDLKIKLAQTENLNQLKQYLEELKNL